MERSEFQSLVIPVIQSQDVDEGEAAQHLPTFLGWQCSNTKLEAWDAAWKKQTSFLLGHPHLDAAVG